MCRSMVDIQSPTAEIRRGIKKKDRKKPQGKNITSASATQGGHNDRMYAPEAMKEKIVAAECIRTWITFSHSKLWCQLVIWLRRFDIYHSQSQHRMWYHNLLLLQQWLSAVGYDISRASYSSLSRTLYRYTRRYDTINLLAQNFVKSVNDF